MRAAELSLDWLPERCASTMRYLQPVSGIAVRQHQAVHYASLFRFDDILLANTHAAGVWACHSPVLQLRRTCSAHLFDFYLRSFERIWGIRPMTEIPDLARRAGSVLPAARSRNPSVGVLRAWPGGADPPHR